MKIIFTIIVALLLFILSNFTVYADQEPKLILNRIMIDPISCSDFDCEWIELKNASTESIDLSSYKYNNSIMNSYILSPRERIIIAKELTDGSDTDLESFEARWGDNSGIWGDSPIESIRAIDDSDIGISVNLSNNGGTILLESIDESELTSYSWDNKYIAYYNYKNSLYGFKNESVLSLEWLDDSISPVIELKINGISSKDQLITQITSKTLNLDLASSTDNTYIVDVNTVISLDGVEKYTRNLSSFDFAFDQIGSYIITSEVTDLNNNKSFMTNYINVLPIFNNLQLNEVYTGKDENKGWLEFVNNNDFDIHLDLYSVEYNGVRYNFADNTTAQKNEYIVLNLLVDIDSYQCLQVYQFDEIIDELCIEDQIIDKSYNVDIENYYLATATKGYVNLSSDSIEEDTSGDKVYSIDEITDLLINKPLKLLGIVNSNTNLFSKDYIYIQKDNKTMKVNIKDIDYKFKFGDKIVVTGIINKDHESQYNIKANNIELITSANNIEAKKINAENLTLDNEGILILISSKIDKSNGSEFYLAGFNKLKIVVLEEWGILKKKGDSVTVKGVLSYYKYGGEIKFILYPISKESVLINQVSDTNVEEEQVLSASTQDNDEEILPNAGMNSYVINLIFVCFIFIIIFLIRFNILNSP